MGRRIESRVGLVLIAAVLLSFLWAMKASSEPPAVKPSPDTTPAVREPVRPDSQPAVQAPTVQAPTVQAPAAQAPASWRAADIGIFRFEAPGAPQARGRLSYNADGTHTGQDDLGLSLPDGTWYRATFEPLDIPPGVDLKDYRALDMALEVVTKAYVGTVTSRQSIPGPNGGTRARKVVVKIAQGGTLYVKALWLRPHMYTFQAYTPAEPAEMPPDFVRFFDSAKLNTAQLLDDAGR